MKTKEQTIDEKNYPSAAIDAADDDKVTSCMEKQYTRELNNNPRNEGQII